MNNLTERRKGFNSIFQATYENGWAIKNTGHDYTKTLLSNSLSSYMFRNTILSTFINDYLNPIMVFYLNKIKYLRIYFNYAVPKNYQKIN